MFLVGFRDYILDPGGSFIPDRWDRINPAATKRQLAYEYDAAQVRRDVVGPKGSGNSTDRASIDRKSCM